MVTRKKNGPSLSNIRVRVFIQNLSAERFWDIEKPVPQVQVATNLNLLGMNQKAAKMLEVPFIFTINYNPVVAQISVKGKGHVTGTEDELKQIQQTHKEKKPPPPVIVQSISNVVFLESVLICRTLNIPPPIPLPKIASTVPKKSSEPTYRA
jgi:hypothetical protein